MRIRIDNDSGSERWQGEPVVAASNGVAAAIAALDLESPAVARAVPDDRRWPAPTAG